MFHPIWVVFVFEGTKTPVYSGCSAAPHLSSHRQAQKWAEMLHYPCILGGPQQRGQNRSTKKATETKTFPLRHHERQRLPAPGVEPETFPSQRHGLPTKVRAIFDRCRHRDGIDIQTNVVFIHY